MKSWKLLLFCLAAVLLPGAVAKGETMKSTGTVPLPYRQFVTNSDQPGGYALVLFLHGAGERGNDNEAQLRHGCRELLAYCEKNKSRQCCCLRNAPPESNGSTNRGMRCAIRCTKLHPPPWPPR